MTNECDKNLNDASQELCDYLTSMRDALLTVNKFCQEQHETNTHIANAFENVREIFLRMQSSLEMLNKRIQILELRIANETNSGHA